MSGLKTFGEIAVKLARNPLGIIALVLVLVYGIAGMVATSSGFEANERYIIVWFVVLFPVFVVVTFYLLVSRHHSKLYAPSDFSDEEHFMKSLESKIAQSPKISNIEEDVQPLIRRALEDDEPDFPKQHHDNDDKEQVKLKPDELRILRVLKEGRYVYRSATGLAKEVLNSNRNLTKDILFNLKEMGAVGERKKGENHRYFITDEGRRLLKHYRE